MRDYKDLHNYQLRAIDHIIENTHCGLFLEMGLGKTVSSLTAINRLIYEELDITRVLVVAPKRVAESVWKQEIEEWTHLNHLKVSRIIGKPKDRLAALRVDADIYTIGRDNLAWLIGNLQGLKLPFDCLILDELSSFKNPKSVRFKSLRTIQPQFRRVIGLTGTPAPNGLIDLWSQIYLLDRGERLGKFIGHYRDEYFKPAKRNGATIYSYSLQKDSENRIHNKIGDICMSMKAKDYLDMPERIDNIIRLEMPKEIEEKYELFEEEQVLDILNNMGESEGVEISALNAAALSNKLLQYANGAIYDENKNYHVVHDLKIEALGEILEDANGSPVLVGWTYRSDMYRMMEAFKKYKPRELKTDQDILDWNAGKVQLLLMHPASGGHGLNLQSGGNIIVWFGQTWSLELYEQFNARLDRQGQKKGVVVNKLVVSGTMDEDVIRSQANKSIKQNALMEAVKAKIKKYERTH